MNAAHNRVRANRKTLSERIKTWLGTTHRRPVTKSTFKPRLESLEVRDVPSTMGVESVPQLQTDMNYLSQVFQQQAASIGKDANVLVQDMQHGQLGRLGSDIVQLQTDFIKTDQAMLGAMVTVWTGNVPSPTTSNASPTPPAATSTSNSSGQHSVQYTPANNSTSPSYQGNSGTSYPANDGGWNNQFGYNPSANTAAAGYFASNYQSSSEAGDLSYSPFSDGYAGPGSY